MPDSRFNKAILPVMFGFFIMGFVDIVGVATNYVKADFSGMNDKVAGLISLSCFLWFLILSIPTGILMNKIGRKKTVLLSFGVTAVAMLIPAIRYDFTFVLIAFTMLGIGNTILQVALNPLVSSVVSSDKLTGTMTLGQFIKAISSFLGPILTAAFAGGVFGWKMVFPVYAAVTILGMVWLALSPINENRVDNPDISFARTFSLLKDNYIVLFFIGILVLVGVDVGMGVTFPKLLQERCGLPLEKAGMGNSVYFLARTIGAFLGGLVLLNLSDAWHARRGDLGNVRNQLPGRLRGGLQRVIRALTRRRVLLPAAIALGFIVAGGEFLCAGQLYLMQLLGSARTGGGLPVLLYCLAFLLPSAAISAIVLGGKSSARVSLALAKNLAAVKLITAVAMLALIVAAWVRSVLRQR